MVHIFSFTTMWIIEIENVMKVNALIRLVVSASTESLRQEKLVFDPEPLLPEYAKTNRNVSTIKQPPL